MRWGLLGLVVSAGTAWPCGPVVETWERAFEVASEDGQLEQLRALSSTGEYERVLTLISRSRPSSPNRARLVKELEAHALLGRGSFPQAMHRFAELLVERHEPRLERKWAEARLRWATDVNTVDEEATAVLHRYRHAGTLDASGHLALARAAIRAGQPKEAAQLCEWAIRLDPASLEALQLCRGRSPLQKPRSSLAPRPCS
ncbi:MAG: tetratricopeptide repeat protein [Myxococcaceae bacterium]|jgi:tetratricopeptide (TPR) repeat protein|nr:tetratricopeptide repeat protein [Myxococcaceae bacterium]